MSTRALSRAMQCQCSWWLIDSHVESPFHLGLTTYGLCTTPFCNISFVDANFCISASAMPAFSIGLQFVSNTRNFQSTRNSPLAPKAAKSQRMGKAPRRSSLGGRRLLRPFHGPTSMACSRKLYIVLHSDIQYTRILAGGIGLA